MTLQLATNLTAMTRAKNRKEMLRNKETRDVSNQLYQNGTKNDQEEAKSMQDPLTLTVYPSIVLFTARIQMKEARNKTFEWIKKI